MDWLEYTETRRYWPSQWIKSRIWYAWEFPDAGRTKTTETAVWCSELDVEAGSVCLTLAVQLQANHFI